MKKTTLRLSSEESKFLTKVTTLGTATALPVIMSPSEFVKLIGIIYFDTELFDKLERVYPDLAEKINPGVDYYSIAEEWFEKPVQLSDSEHILLMRQAVIDIPDFCIYLRCLSELHKRRRKYSKILTAQPMPTMVQVSPRSLIEYGQVEPEALASWLTWRKFFYDLDNRSAQETGYLFEPILAAAIGGEPKGARAKVVKRTDDASKGRQVDCWKAEPGKPPLAYEFKLRVTIAASGQGRLGEEHKFAVDCKNSGAIPVLVILDPTPNPTMAGLKAVYEENGGHAYIGDEAWAHLEEEAGPVMARFIEKYVRAPVTQISAFEKTIAENSSKRHIQLLDLSARASSGEIRITLGSHERVIVRNEDQALMNESEDDNED